MEKLPSENIDISEQLKYRIGGKPTAVYLIAPGTAAGKNHLYKSPSMLDGEYFRGKKFGYLGGSLRVYAVAYLHRYFHDAIIITSSKVEGISQAEIQERELLEIWKKWQTPPPSPENIIKEEKSTNTMQEMAELIRLIVENNWRGNIVVVTNDYHVQRVVKTLEHLPYLITPQDPSFNHMWNRFKDMDDVGLSVIDAESILSTVSSKFKKVLGEIFEKEPWKSYRKLRLESEERGLKALEDNTYQAQPLKF